MPPLPNIRLLCLLAFLFSVHIDTVHTRDDATSFALLALFVHTRMSHCMYLGRLPSLKLT